ncbi:MAG: hypothetical protein ACYCPS_04855 [Candidatus Saccharimonadales bacterium]
MGNITLAYDRAMLDRLTPKNWRPTYVAATILVVVAGAGVFVYAEHWLRRWMPNVVIGALTVAVTITLVDAAIKGDAKHRSKGRLGDALDAISYPLKGVLFYVALDYGQTHTSRRELPSGPVEVFDFWLAEEPQRDRDRHLLADSDTTILIDGAGRLRDTLERHRTRDQDIFPTELLRTADRFIEAAEHTAALAQVIRANVWPDPQKELQKAHQQIVEAARAFCIEYVKERPKWSPVDHFVRAAAEVSIDEEGRSDPGGE